MFPNQLTAWVKLTELWETFPLGDNDVTEWEVYGKDVGEQGAAIARTLSRNGRKSGSRHRPARHSAIGDG